MVDEYALAQAQISGIFVEAALKEYVADWRKGSEDKTVMRDSATGQFAKKASRSPTQSEDTSENPLSNALSVLRQPAKAKEHALALLDDVKKGVDRIKTAKPEDLAKVAKQIMKDGVPAAIYLAQTFGPDVIIGLSLGESLPIILGGAAVYLAVSKVAEKMLEESEFDNPWIKAGVNLAVSLVTADLAKGILTATKAAKFNAQGVYKIVQAGKTADDLKATVKTVTQQVDKMATPAKNLLEQQRRDRFLHSLTLTAETSKDNTTKNLFKNLADYCSGKLSSPSENLTRYVEKEISGLRQSLKGTSVDVDGLADRLAQMSDLTNTPLLLRNRRIDDVKNIVQRAKEIPQAAKDIDGIAHKAVIKQVDDLRKKFAQQIKNGVPYETILRDPELINSSLLVDKANAIEFGNEWRSMLVNTEIKYGKQLDEFLDSVTKNPKDIGDRYEVFLGNLVKDKPQNVKIGRAADYDFLRNKPYGVKDRDKYLYQPWADKGTRDMIADECQKAAELFGRLSPVQLDVRIGSHGPRAYQIGNIINVSTGDFTHTWHELTHVLERTMDKGFELSSAFRGARTTGRELKDMAHLGMPGEKAVVDRFLNTYTGKVYTGNSTEILTTAAEKMATAEGLHHLATLDREQLMFFLSVLDRG
jgi:uncharacterized protein YoxC